MFKNMKIGTMLAVGFGFMLFMLTAIAGGSNYIITFMDHMIEDIQDDKLPKVILLYEIQEQFYQMNQIVQDITLRKEGVDFIKEKKMKQGEETLAQRLAALDKKARSADGRAAFKTLTEAYAEFIKHRDNLFNQINEGKYDESVHYLYEVLPPITNNSFEAIQAMLKHQDESLNALTKKADVMGKKSAIYLAVFGLLALFLGSIAGWLIARFVKGNLRALVAETSRISTIASQCRLDERGNIDVVAPEFQGIITGINAVLESIITIIDKLPMPVIAMSTDFQVVWGNESSLALLATSRTELAGKHCADLLQAGDCHTERCACTKAISQGTFFTSETHARPHGMEMEVTYYGVPIKDNSGKVSSVVEIFIDQTEIKKANLAASQVNAFQQVENNKLVDAMEHMADGDLTFRLESEPAEAFTVDTKKRYDEIYNAMAKGTGALAEAIGAITVNARQVASATAQTSSAIGMISDGSQNQLHAIAQVATAVKQTSASILDVARNTEEASQLAKESVAIVQDGQSRMREMIQVVNAIAAGSEKINKITEVIEKIANKTNLLSLNAAIEAARAGEHGRGFAVVAEEVGKLAANAAESTQEISALVEQAVKEANHAVAAASKVNEGMDRIAEGSSTTDSMLQRISAALEQQSAAVQEVNANVNGLTKVAESNAAAAEEITATVFELAKIADNTRQEAERFRV